MALTEEDKRSLINNYLSALVQTDEAILKNSWEQLNQNPEALFFMEQYYPNQFASFKMQGLAFQLRAMLNDQRLDNEKREEEVRKLREAIAREALKIRRRKPTPNDITVLKFPNIVTTASANNATLNPNIVEIDNGLRALAFPNQDRIPNQDIIRNRVDTLLGPRSKEYGINPVFESGPNAEIIIQP